MRFYRFVDCELRNSAKDELADRVLVAGDAGRNVAGVFGAALDEGFANVKNLIGNAGLNCFRTRVCNQGLRPRCRRLDRKYLLSPTV